MTKEKLKEEWVIAVEQRERVDCVYKVCSPSRPFQILPNPEGVFQERFNFLFPPSLSPHTAVVMALLSTAHTLKPFQTKCLATRSEVFIFNLTGL